MKKLTKIFMGLSIPTTAMAFLPVASCGNKEKALILDLKHDDHVTNVTTGGELLTNKSFKIIATFSSGWQQFNTETTYIKVDGNKLTSGTDYEFQGTDTILVHENVIKSTNVEVYVTAKATYSSSKFEWTNLGSDLKVISGYLCVPLGASFGYKNVNYTVTFGDGSTVTPEYGQGKGKYILLNKNGGQEIPNFGTDGGYTYPETIFEGHTKLVQIPLYCQYTENISGTSLKGKTILAHAGKKPTTLTIKYTEAEISVGEKIGLECSAGTNEFTFCDYEITTGSDNATIAKDQETGTWSITGKKAGSVTIKATSIFDSSKTAEGTFTIKS